MDVTSVTPSPAAPKSATEYAMTGASVVGKPGVMSLQFWEKPGELIARIKSAGRIRSLIQCRIPDFMVSVFDENSVYRSSGEGVESIVNAESRQI
jgi:hypothetical protein